MRGHRLPPAASAAIVGGSDAMQGAWGYLALVVHYDAAGNADFLCSGTVISNNVVLTAGHCAVDETTGSVLDPSRFVVVTGSVDWTNSSQRQVSDVSRVVAYPGYDPATAHGDAALLVLSTPTTASTVRLATTADQALDQPGQLAFIVGWGDTFAGSPLQFLLQWAPIGVQRPAYCANFDSSFNGSLELCTVDYPNIATGTCQGDSGGPLVAADSNNQAVQIGITSRGPVDCSTAIADYFTRADLISSWARYWVAAVGPPSPAPPAPPAPPPPPAPKLPTMTSSAARGLVRTTLAGVFPRTFKRGHQYTVKCSRKSAVRFSFGVTYWSGANDYYGSVTVYYLRGSGSQVYWNDSYAMKVGKRSLLLPFWPPPSLHGPQPQRRVLTPSHLTGQRLPLERSTPRTWSSA